MNEKHAHTEELLQEVKQVRRAIRRAAYIIAGGMVLSTLIAAGFFASGGEIIWTCAIVAAIIWAFVAVIGSTLSKLSKNRIAARIDRERKAALSGRTSNLSPVNK